MYIDEIPPRPSLLQVEQSQPSQPLLVGDAPVPSSSLWPFAGPSPVAPYWCFGSLNQLGGTGTMLPRLSRKSGKKAARR